MATPAPFSNAPGDWLEAQRYCRLRQRWMESFALGKMALQLPGIGEEELPQCSRMLCEASLALGDAGLTAQTLFTHLRDVDASTCTELLRRFLQECPPADARRVLPTLGYSPVQYRELAHALFDQRKFDIAEAVGDCWETDYPGLGFEPATTFLPWVYWRQLRYDKALGSFEAGYARFGDIGLLIGKAMVLCAMGRYADSVACYREVEQLRPLTGDECKSIAKSLFGAGHVRESMERYEERLSSHDFSASAPSRLRLWNGEALQGKLLVMWDPGWSWGDYLMHARYIPLLQKRVANICVQTSAEVHPDAILDPVIRAACPGVEILSRNDCGSCVAYVWLMSLPVVLQIWSPAAQTLPWIDPGEQRARQWTRWWADQDAGAPRRRRIGLCWSGNPNTHHDYFRSVKFEDLTPLFAGMPNIDWVNLQWAASQRPPPELLAEQHSRWLNPMPLVSGLLDTAALALTLDEVLTIDSAVAHLCGSAGVHMTLLVPIWGEWRWQAANRSPWYPAAKLVRTPPQSTFRETIRRLADSRLSGQADG